MASSPAASTMDKLMLIIPVARTIFHGLTRIVYRPFNSGARPNTFYKDVVFAMVRTWYATTNAAQEQYINPTTEVTYLAVAKEEGFKPDTFTLPSGVKAHWLGKRTAEKVLLHFHGGGFVVGCPYGHLQWLYALTQHISANHNFASVMLEYTLAAQGQYPTQLKQATELLEYMISAEKRKPSSILIGGDSAGANLTLSLMSHLIHPHPDVSSNVHEMMSEPLLGAILISPWVNFATDDESYTKNSKSDLLTPTTLKRWSSAFLGKSPADQYNEPAVKADMTWFNGLDLRVKDILVWGGGGEVLIDSIKKIGNMLKEAQPRTEIVIEPGRAHEEFIQAFSLGLKKDKTEGMKLTEGWISDKLST